MNKTDLHILMLEDEPLDVELNMAQLALLDEYNCIVNVAGDKTSYLNALDNSSPDIILSDYNLPQYTGLEALNDLNKRNKLIPFVFVTGTMNEETAAGTIKAGAWDYVVKDRLFRLPLAVRSVLKLKDERLLSANAEEKINRLLTGIEQTSVQIIVTNEKAIIEYVNKKFTDVTGLTPEEVFGKEAYTLLFDDLNSIYLPAITEKLMKGEVYRGEELSKMKDGSTFWVLTSITPVRNDEGIITSYVAVREDITQRKLIEQELIKALDKAERSDKLKDVFLQNLSHEIRTPLNAIVGFSDLLNTGTGNSEDKIKEFTSIIHQSSYQLLSIVTDILTIASIQTGQETVINKPVNINKLFDHLYEIFLPFASEKKLHLSVMIDNTSSPLLILTDETKLNQILTNLLNNALKFTQQGSIDLKCVINGNIICFSVSDTGIGISKESQSVIFERFRQAEDTTHIEYGGTGLGLSISKSFAQMLGGTIQVESEPGKGSTFTLSIPYSSGQTKTSKEKPSHVILQNKSLTILVAEDEINNFLLIKAFLNNHNVSILYAENGLDAVRLCEENPDIDLVLMDIKMPVMDGIAAFNKIRTFRKDLPVIAQTAYGLEREKQQFLDTGFNEYISKPIKKEILLETIQKCLK
jgi:PAS domain S-box-containing protein